MNLKNQISITILKKKQKFNESTKFKNKEIKWYFDTLGKKDFEAQKEREITFKDDFNNPELYLTKYMTGFYLVKTLMNDHYLLVGENKFFTDSNISINHGVLLKYAIITIKWTNNNSPKYISFLNVKTYTSR